MPTPYDNFQLAQSTAIRKYAGAPVEEFGKMLEKREQDYQTNVIAADQLELMANDLDVNDADYAVEKGLVDKSRETIQGIADSGGAYEFAGSQMRQLARQFTGNQDLKAALENQVQIREQRAKLEDRYLEGDISMNAYNKGKADLDTYEGIGEGVDGVYNKPTIYDPLKYIHIEDKLNEFGKGWKESLQTFNSMNEATGTIGVYSQTTKRFIDEDEVREAMYEHIEGIPDLKAYIEEEARITGSTVEEIVGPMVESQVKKLGFTQKVTVPKQIPGFKAKKEASITGLGGYTQKVSVGKDESLNSGSTGLKTKVAELGAIKAAKKTELATYKSQGADENTIATLSKELDNIEYLEQSYIDAGERAKANLEAKYPGQSFDNLDEAVIQKAKDDASMEWRDAQQESGTGLTTINPTGVTQEEYSNTNYIKYLKDVSPMYADYEEAIQNLGQPSNYEGEAILGSNEKANKEIDDFYDRVTVPKTGLFYETGPLQGTQIPADLYEEATNMTNGGLGVDANGEIVALVGLKDKDGTPLGDAAHHKDQKIIAGLMRSLTPEERMDLQVSSLIVKASSNPNKNTRLEPIKGEDGREIQSRLEIITDGLNSSMEMASGQAYKITDSEGREQKFANAEALEIFLTKRQNIINSQK